MSKRSTAAFLFLALSVSTHAHAAFTCKGLLESIGLSKDKSAKPVVAGSSQSNYSAAQIPASEFEAVFNRLMKTEEGALDIQRKDPSTAGLIKFNEFLDQDIRSNPEYSASLLELALRRLPYLKNEAFNLVLTGGVVDPWVPVLKEEIARRQLKVNLILLPGSLSFARSDRRDVPDFPKEFHSQLASLPSIFMDDTYTNGGTAQAVRLKLKELGGDLDGVFVVYEGGKGDPASLYKSGRMNQRPPSMGQFRQSPTQWNNTANIKRMAIELDGTVYVQGTTEVTTQAATLLNQLSLLNIEVTPLKNGRPVEASAALKTAFPHIRFVKEESYDLAMGNWGKQFLGNERKSADRPRTTAIETVKISSHRDWGQLESGLLDKNYFLNRLSEEGVLEPVFARKEQTRSSEAGLILDLRKVKSVTLPVAEILRIEDPKERVRQLNLLDGSVLETNEKDLLIQLAQTSQNSFELGALIKVSSDTKDARWIPILSNWVQEWSQVSKGWQTFVRPEAEKQLGKLKAMNLSKSSSNTSLKVATEGTTNNGELKEGLLPRGSALLTSSGALADSGITAIIHAASGSMSRSGGVYEPNLQSIHNSVANSVRLAEANGHTRVVVPMIGGGIFLSRLGGDINALAKEIVKGALQGRKNIEVRFIGFEATDVKAFEVAVNTLATHAPAGAMAVIQGSITNAQLHGASAIVNAANTEVIFGGGISGVIGRATQNSEAINQEAKKLIQQLK